MHTGVIHVGRALVSKLCFIFFLYMDDHKISHYCGARSGSLRLATIKH